MSEPSTHEPELAGVQIRDLTMEHDERGVLTEVFRDEWGTGFDPVQWNVIRSRPGALRGMHVHVKHDDYQVVVEGRAYVVLVDLRRHAPTFKRRFSAWVSGERLCSLAVPRGVLHGFLFDRPSTLVIGVDRTWDPADVIACHPEDPELGVAWPTPPRHMAERDRRAGGLTSVLERIEAHQNELWRTAAPVPR